MNKIFATLLFFYPLLIGPQAMAKNPSPKYEMAILAGGCFWCLQKPYDSLKGVVSTVVGYTGGHTPKPDYKKVSAGGSGHYEALKVIYDPAVVSFKDILDVFWRNVDPFDGRGQFCDRGDQYSAAVFYLNDGQKELAQASKAEHEKLLGKKIVTEIVRASDFFEGEAYHQKYYDKNPIRYKFYRYKCGRDQRLEEIWGEK